MKEKYLISRDDVLKLFGYLVSSYGTDKEAVKLVVDLKDFDLIEHILKTCPKLDRTLREKLIDEMLGLADGKTMIERVYTLASKYHYDKVIHVCKTLLGERTLRPLILRPGLMAGSNYDEY